MSQKILVINTGSTSLKYKFFEVLEKEVKGEKKFIILKENYFPNISKVEEAIKNTLREIGDLRDLIAVGHRVVHGGEEFTEPTVVNKEVLAKLAKYNHLAPLHNPYNLAGIKAVEEYLPGVPNIAVFDTAFYRDLPAEAKIYALPHKFYEAGFRRFGFHGLSHEYVAHEAAQQLERKFKDLKLITCHLGGGSSITAISQGKAIDTSMGFTPLEGLVMMTRGGDLDPGFILHFLKSKLNNLDTSDSKSLEKVIEELDNLLNRESGLKGLSDINDYQELIKEMSLGQKRAKLAFQIFIYRLKKYIGAYLAILGHIDALIFTGAIGAGNPITRKTIIKDLSIIKEAKVFSIPTNEELMIARKILK